MAGGVRIPKPSRDKRKTSVYYMVTGVFAMVLILVAVAFFRSPSDEANKDVVETNEAAQLNNKQDVPAEDEKKEPTPTAEELKKEAEIEKEIDELDKLDKLDNPETVDKKTDTEAKVQDDKQVQNEQPEIEKPNEGQVQKEQPQTEKPSEEVQNEQPQTDEEETEGDDESDEEKADDVKQEAVAAEETKEAGGVTKEPTDEQGKTPTKEDASTFPEETIANGTELELTVENKEISNAWASQANESKQEKKQEESVQPSAPVEAEKPPEPLKDGKADNTPTEQKSVGKESSGTYDWKLCSFSNAADYIPCLDNQKAIKKLKSRSHYEHRERHCPSGEDIKTCLIPLPQGYQAHVNWPQSRKQVWYTNVPHPGLVSYKKDQNWVRKKDDLLIFPGGGTQFKQGAERYIEFIEISVPAIAWGKHSRTVLDVGCGVASFGGFLFDKNVLTMSFAPKDEHEAQVQLALERGIPAILAVMGTQRLVYPSNVYDVAHCARCRVPWHLDGGKLLLELNRLIRPGGYFIWSATPVYKKEQEDIETWRETKALADAMCWKMIVRQKDPHTGVGIAVFQKPTSNSCYEKRAKNSPPVCEDADNPDAAWYVPMQSCLHKIPADGARGSRWPEEWPQRVNATPHWLGTVPKGLFGKAATEEFQADTEHWHHVIERSYARGLEIDWTIIRNVMDMKAGYGGFAAALSRFPVWVLNVVPITEPDTLPIIFDRGLIGQYHDWCESFSTYPRTYDLLHADHLFSRLKQSCGVLNTIVEMDRILRPGGWAIFRDTTATLGEIEPMIKSLHWEIRVSYKQDQEQLIAAQKTFWRPSSS